jgi:hypothetical protein
LPGAVEKIYNTVFLLLIFLIRGFECMEFYPKGPIPLHQLALLLNHPPLPPSRGAKLFKHPQMPFAVLSAIRGVNVALEGD